MKKLLVDSPRQPSLMIKGLTYAKQVKDNMWIASFKENDSKRILSDMNDAGIKIIHMPAGYTIGIDGEYLAGKPRIVVLYLGDRIEQGWYMDVDDAKSTAWMDFYGKHAASLNESREDERFHVLAWRLPDGKVYTADHLDHHVDFKDLEEITIATHSVLYEIAKLICEHCGCAAVDDEILDKYQLLNEGWGYGENDETD